MSEAPTKTTGERMTPGMSHERSEQDHVARYTFAAKHVTAKRVLDIACGTGYGTAMLADGHAREVVGVDISAEAISYATKHYVRPNVSFIQSSAERVEFPEGYFDVIISFETIEHLEEGVRSMYLKELNRVLKDNGTLFISTPNKKITSPWTWGPSNSHHVLEYTKGGFVRELMRHGFVVDTWYGQRFVRTLLSVRLVRLMVVCFERLSGVRFELYHVADGPEVRPLQPGFRARYFVAEAKKVGK